MERDLKPARYATFLALALILGFYLLTLATWSPWLSLLVALISAGLGTAVLEYWLRLSLERSNDKPSIKLENQELFSSMLRLQRNYLSAQSNKDVLEAILEFGQKFLQARGSSFLPYGNWGQSLPALFQGDVPDSVLQGWSSRLRAAETRQTCRECQILHGGPGCGLLAPDSSAQQPVMCFSIKLEKEEIGVLNFYFWAVPDAIDQEKLKYFKDVVGLAENALAGLHAREQEMAALRYLQQDMGPKNEAPNLLGSLLNNVLTALDLDFALFYIPSELSAQADSPLLLSRVRQGGAVAANEPDLPFIEGVWRSVSASGKPVSLKNVTLNNKEMWQVLLALPLSWSGEHLSGVLMLGSNSHQSFSARHLMLLETIATQAALLTQNAHLMKRVEYQAVVDERTRLAREIHDGLAQTLAFLKIQSSQMQNYAMRGDMDRLTSTLQSNYQTLSEAYLDARQAIDNLRRLPTSNLRNWLNQVIQDFEDGTDINVITDEFDFNFTLQPNIQAQLIRIVQEGLSNIRKHAKATQVKLIGRQISGGFLVEIVDNGLGFDPERLGLEARYGLRGMRERAETINADFQIRSKVGQGTTVSLFLIQPEREVQ